MMEDHAKQKAAMTPPEPQTAAGRALLDAYGRAEYSDGALRLAILAIEAEAQLIGFDDAWNKAEADSEALRAALERLIQTREIYLDAVNGLGHSGEPHNSDLGISGATVDDCSACGGAQYGAEDDMSRAFDEARAALTPETKDE
jgi:hypothetical protein